MMLTNIYCMYSIFLFCIMNTVLQDALATLFGFTLITFHQLKL